MMKQGSSNTNKRQVTFHGVVEIQEIPSCTQFSSTLIERCYYSKEELQVMKFQEPKRMNHKKCCKGECLRGLECKTNSKKLVQYLRKQQSQRATFAVMDEQQLQFDAQNVDHDALAAAYSQHTQQSQMDAYNVALIDELYVRRHVYSENEDDGCDMMPCSTSTTNNEDLYLAEKYVKNSDTALYLCTCASSGAASSSTSTLSPFSLKKRRTTTSNDHPRNNSTQVVVSLRTKIRRFYSSNRLPKIAPDA